MLYIENQNKSNRFKLINNFLQINKQNKFSNDKFTKYLQIHLQKYKINNFNLFNNIKQKINIFFNTNVNIQYNLEDINDYILCVNGKNNLVNLNKIDIHKLDTNNIYYINNIDTISIGHINSLKNNDIKFVIDFNSKLHNMNNLRISNISNNNNNTIPNDDLLINFWCVLNYNSIFI